MDYETWRFINTFAPWLSALGTFTAVLVSLYLASRQDRINLKVSAGVRVLVQPGSHKEYVVVSAINAGRREVTVNSFGWQIGLFRKINLFQVPGASPYATTLPTRLLDGQEGRYLLPTAPDALNTEDWVGTMRGYLGRFPMFAAFFTKIQVFTSVGITVEARIDQSLRKLLREHPVPKKS